MLNFDMAKLARKVIRMKYPNFYETVAEANIRLRGTIVLYDGVPHYIHTITDHKTDGIFRIYMHPTGYDDSKKFPKIPALNDYPPGHEVLGPILDKWMENNTSSGVIRKSMNSSLFNKFRPYPLGMCNSGTQVYYIERLPNRKTEQGLVKSMLDYNLLSLGYTKGKSSYGPDTTSVAFRDCVLGAYPSAKECLEGMLDPTVENEAVAFHRQFALVRGPINMMFLAYKADIVGVLPNKDFSTARIDRSFAHVKEAIEGLKLFGNIIL